MEVGGEEDLCREGLAGFLERTGLVDFSASSPTDNGTVSLEVRANEPPNKTPPTKRKDLQLYSLFNVGYSAIALFGATGALAVDGALRGNSVTKSVVLGAVSLANFVYAEYILHQMSNDYTRKR